MRWLPNMYAVSTARFTDRSNKPRREANGGAQCGKSACCVRRGGGWKCGRVEMLRPQPARQSSTLPVRGSGCNSPGLLGMGGSSAQRTHGQHCLSEQTLCRRDCGPLQCQLPTSGEPPLTTAVEPSRSSSLSDGSCPHCGHCQEPVAGSQWGRHRGRQGKARQSRHRRDLGVSPATLYRYIPAAGTANSPSVAEFS